MIYRFRIILDNKEEEDIFRDLEIRQTDTLEDLHNAITQAFGFDGMEMASFYLSDDKWNQGEEISLFDLSDGQGEVRLMNETILEDILDKDNTKLIYVYDFLSMWTFYVELAAIVDKEDGRSYPNILFAFGDIPDSPPERQFESDPATDVDDPLDNYEDLGFEENWN